MKGKELYMPPEAVIWQWESSDVITTSEVSLFDSEGNPIWDSWDSLGT